MGGFCKRENHYGTHDGHTHTRASRAPRESAKRHRLFPPSACAQKGGHSAPKGPGVLCLGGLPRFFRQTLGRKKKRKRGQRKKGKRENRQREKKKKRTKGGGAKKKKRGGKKKKGGTVFTRERRRTREKRKRAWGGPRNRASCTFQRRNRGRARWQSSTG